MAQRYPDLEHKPKGSRHHRSHAGVKDSSSMHALLRWLELSWGSQERRLRAELACRTGFDDWLLALAQALEDSIGPGRNNVDAITTKTGLLSLSDLVRQPWVREEQIELMLWVAWMWSRGRKQRATDSFLATEQRRTGLSGTALRALLAEAAPALESFEPVHPRLWHLGAAKTLLLHIDDDRDTVRELSEAIVSAAPLQEVRTEVVTSESVLASITLVAQPGDAIVLIWSRVSAQVLGARYPQVMKAAQQAQSLVFLARDPGVEVPAQPSERRELDLMDMPSAARDLLKVLGIGEQIRQNTGRRVATATPLTTMVDGVVIHVISDRFRFVRQFTARRHAPAAELLWGVVDSLGLPRYDEHAGVRTARYDYALFFNERKLDERRSLDEQGIESHVTLDLGMRVDTFPDGPPPVMLGDGFMRTHNVPANKEAALSAASETFYQALRTAGLAV